jgi:hypothetical protein
LGNDLSRHSSFDFDGFRLEPTEAMNLSFALDNDMACADSPRNFACKVNRRGVIAMQIAAEPALN